MHEEKSEREKEALRSPVQLFIIVNTVKVKECLGTEAGDRQTAARGCGMKWLQRKGSRSDKQLKMTESR